MVEILWMMLLNEIQKENWLLKKYYKYDCTLHSKTRLNQLHQVSIKVFMIIFHQVQLMQWLNAILKDRLCARKIPCFLKPSQSLVTQLAWIEKLHVIDNSFIVLKNHKQYIAKSSFSIYSIQEQFYIITDFLHLSSYFFYQINLMTKSTNGLEECIRHKPTHKLMVFRSDLLVRVVVD